MVLLRKATVMIVIVVPSGHVDSAIYGRQV